MPEAIETLEGWYALHDLRRVDWESWHSWPASRQESLVGDLKIWMANWQQKNHERQAGFGAYQIVGHKADLMFIYFCPTLEDFSRIEAHFRKPGWAELLVPTWSYLSVVELSQYMAKGENPETSAYLRSRLYPQVPDALYVSFYPMKKRREGSDNWYMLSPDERRGLMKSHGLIGHSHRSRVHQIITGSQGLDDWEWGVTLFANDPIAFKKIVYEMRFDEASARYADFGQFFTGIRLDPAHLPSWFQDSD